MFNVVVVLIVLVSIVKGQTDPCSPGGHEAIPNIGFRFVNYRLDATDVLLHDYRLPSGWYYAGNVTMPEHPPDDIFTCGTKFPVWLNGSHPTNSTPVSARACQMGVRNTCGVSYNIKIQRCTGFYVYQLTKTTSISVGYCFGIGATGAPPKFVPSKPRVKPGVKDGGYFRKTPITETVFSCIFEESKTEKLQFIVSWYMNQRFMYRTEYRDSPSDAALQLTEYEFNRTGFRLGTNISCSVRAFIKRDSAPGKSSDCADDFFAGIRVLSEYLTFEADEMDESKRSIRLYATVPIGCVGSICHIELEANVPDNGACTSIAFNAMCGVQIESNTYNQTLNLPIKYVEDGRYFTGVLHKIFLKTVNIYDNMIWSNYSLPPIKIRIRPSAKLNVYKGKRCSSFNDPHITTFDGRRYDNQQEGVYIMYRNTNYSAEVQTKYQNCYKGNEKIKCNCGVAVKAGRDLFEFNICNDKTFIGHRFCSDKVLVVKSLGEKKYKTRLEKAKKPYRNYSPTALTNAYKFVREENVSVRKAAHIHGVPETTLRDRVLGNIHPDTVTVGKAPLFTQYEEACLVKHFKNMAELGYGYSRRECVVAASDYAVQLGKREHSEPLTIKWMKGFIKRWPELKVLKPRSLELARAKMASVATVDEYFRSLKQCLQRHGLTDKPHLIYNVDEKGISVEHKPPHIVASSAYCPSAVTSGRGKTVTILGGGNAAGFAIPPFFVFPGKRMQHDLLKGASPGADGTMSESGWSNGVIFRQYIENHFLKFVPNHPNQKILLLLDGHKSHVSVGLSEWAQNHNLVIFILPPHTSHILQPMDVSCYGPFQNIYNALCHKAIRSTYAGITRYEVCDLACRTYIKALSPENIISGFRRTGIHPLNPSSIPCEYLLPSTVYNKHSDSDNDSQATVEGGEELNIFERREKDLKKVKGEIKGKQRDTVSKIVAGKEISESVIEQMVVHENKHKKVRKSCEIMKEQENKDKTRHKMCGKNVVKQKHIPIESQLPGPSHINLVSDNESSLTLTDEDDSDEELCCVCDRRSPEEMRKSIPLVIVKWVQCDGIQNGLPCKHWVHLQFCTKVRVVRRGDIFLCPHCTDEN